jgi:8-oxo-dGTP pyrophosphatase MutT (NUDIX family)
MNGYFYKDPHAPKADTLHFGTAIAIWYHNQILLDHRRDGQWGLIGGALELGESLEDCAKREVLEETGLVATNLQLIGTFSDPSRIIARQDKVLQCVTICFSVNIETNKVRISDESKELKFCSKEDLGHLQIVPTHQMIIPYLFTRNTWPVIM